MISKMYKFLTIVIFLLSASCTSKNKDSNVYVEFQTDFGNIIVKLYKETPKHKKNFLELSEKKFYDGLIFHRVIKDFVVQGGDPDTRNPIPGKLYGESDAGYLIDPEFCDTIIHKRGSIAMAREGDEVNPGKKSSSSQFYFVVGKVYTEEELNKLEVKLNVKLKEKIEKKLFDSLLKDNSQFDTKFLQNITQLVQHKADSIFKFQKIKFSDFQRKTYTTIGGIPHLDGNYTVFGEVVEGYDVIENISKVETDNNDRPVTDVKMIVKVLKR
ncbi:MAG: peptidylprolyl isomerase [Candidatus Hydrogenedens sp.]|nr:peptidylprolyl isomerase [Candidatus Hydrogenedens sp.]